MSEEENDATCKVDVDLAVHNLDFSTALRNERKSVSRDAIIEKKVAQTDLGSLLGFEVRTMR